MWTIHVRDPLNQRQALLDRYEKFEAVKRLNKVGSWVLDVYGGVWFYTTNSRYLSIPTLTPKRKSPSAPSKVT